MPYCETGQITDMGILKFLLSLILVFILAWGGLVSFGPKLITYIVHQNTGEQVRVNDLKISPKLEITSQNVDFNIKLPDSKKIIAGDSRAAVLTWSISGFEPKLTLRLGPTSINDLGNLRSVELNFIWDSLAVWSLPRLTANFDNVVVGNLVNLDYFRLQGYFSKDLENLKDVTFDVSWSDQQNKWSSQGGTATGSLAQFDITQSLLSQNNELLFEVSRLSPQNFDFELIKPKISLSNNYGEILVSATSERAELTHSDGMFKNLQLTGSYFWYEGEWGDPVEVSVSEGSFGALQLGFSNFFFEVIGQVPHVKFVGAVNGIDLGIGGQYFGKVDAGEIVADFQFPTAGEVTKASGTTELRVLSTPELLVEAKIVSNIAQNNILKCLSQKCLVSKIVFEYLVNVSNEFLFGSSFCEDPACAKSLFDHKVELNNTSSFFEGLGRTNIFSPLALSYMYLQVASGVAKGAGHVYKF